MTDLEDELNDLCQRAVAVFGATAQLRQLQEECGELVAAVSQYERGRIDELGLADKVADVIVMCVQATSIVGTGHVARALAVKLRRLRGLVEGVEKRLEMDA